MKKFLQGPGLLVAAFVIVILMSTLLGGGQQQTNKNIGYTQLLEMVRQDTVSELAVTNDAVFVRTAGSAIAESVFPTQYDFVAVPPADTNKLYEDINAIYASKLGISSSEISPADYGFVVKNYRPEPVPWWVDWIPFLIIGLLFAGLWLFIMRQQQGANSKMMSFGKSRVRVQDKEKNKVTFAQVAGADEEKEELAEIVEFLKNPKRFSDLGARIPKGVLLVGPPGTGKTLLAKAVSGEAGVPFFSISGSDFVEMFVGVGASRVRDLFEQAKKNAPAIIFIDEIDAVGRQRGAGLGGGHDEREQTLNQLLVEMDGFLPNEGVIVMAATNRVDILDPALLRPGRFDRQVTMHYPDIKGRKEVLQVHAKGKPLAEDVDLGIIAQRTPFFTPADLENVMNESAILAARRHKTRIEMPELEEAITRVMVGPEKRSQVVTQKDKELVAYHESGHAVLAYMLPNCDPVHEVSIIPRGQAGGYTMTLPSEEKHYVTSAKMLDRICELMGGHAAERVFLNDVSNGSTSDLKRATQMARAMVVEYGMNDAVGPVYLGGGQEVFVGRDLTSTRNFSEQFAATIDAETRGILETAYQRAVSTLTENRDKVETLVKLLLEREKIDTHQFKALMSGEAIAPQPAE